MTKGLYLVLVTSIVGHVGFGDPVGKYKSIVDRMQALHTKYPAVSSIFSIGTNDEATEIFAMRVSATPGTSDASKVAHIVVSTHHGDEGGAPEFTMYFMEELLKKYS